MAHKQQAGFHSAQVVEADGAAPMSAEEAADLEREDAERRALELFRSSAEATLLAARELPPDGSWVYASTEEVARGDVRNWRELSGYALDLAGVLERARESEE